MHNSKFKPGDRVRILHPTESRLEGIVIQEDDVETWWIVLRKNFVTDVVEQLATHEGLMTLLERAPTHTHTVEGEPSWEI